MPTEHYMELILPANARNARTITGLKLLLRPFLLQEAFSLQLILILFLTIFIFYFFYYCTRD